MSNTESIKLPGREKKKQGNKKDLIALAFKTTNHAWLK